MTSTSADLLRALGSGVRPVRPPGALPAPGGALTAGQIQQSGFAELLSKAQSGQVESGLSITVAPGSGLNLTAEQLARLSQAADRAQAQGLREALVLIDGMAVKLDVFSRTVTAKADLNAGGVMSGVDGVVVAPGGAGGAGPTATPVPGPADPARTDNASVRRLLAAG
jgi:hypothetical protein